jgi:hypothetical protein
MITSDALWDIISSIASAHGCAITWEVNDALSVVCPSGGELYALVLGTAVHINFRLDGVTSSYRAPIDSDSTLLRIFVEQAFQAPPTVVPAEDAAPVGQAARPTDPAPPMVETAAEGGGKKRGRVA